MVRRTEKRRQFRQIRAGGGGAAGNVYFARGVPVSVDCDYATLEVGVQYMSVCGDVPDENYEGNVCVQDPYGIMDGYTDAEVLAAEWVRIEYVYNLADCVAQWELTLIKWADECQDQNPGA